MSGSISVHAARLIVGWAALALVTMPAARAADAPLRLAYSPSGDAWPLFVAQEKGFFTRHGLAVTYTVIPSTSIVTSALIAGSVDMGLITTVGTIEAAESGLDLTFVAGAHAMPSQCSIGMVGGAGRGVTAASQLVGRKIGVPSIGTVLHLMANRWLEENGVDYTKVTFVEIPNSQVGDLLKTGQVDAAAVPCPYIAQVLEKQQGTKLGEIYKTAPAGFLLSGYATLRPWALAHPQLLGEFRAALDEGDAYMRANEAEARTILAKWTKLPEAAVTQVGMPGYAVEMQRNNLTTVIGEMEHQGRLRGTPDLAALITK